MHGGRKGMGLRAERRCYASYSGSADTFNRRADGLQSLGALNSQVNKRRTAFVQSEAKLDKKERLKR